MSFTGLRNLIGLSIAKNSRFQTLNDMGDLQKLVNLDLSDTRITRGWSHLSQLKSLKVLDLGHCRISMPTSDFQTLLLKYLKEIPKLQYINFAGNPVETSIHDFKYLVIYELPELKYYNWETITKEERSKAEKLGAAGHWSSKTSAPAIKKEVRTKSRTRQSKTTVSPSKADNDKNQHNEEGEHGGSNSQDSDLLDDDLLQELEGKNYDAHDENITYFKEIEELLKMDTKLNISGDKKISDSNISDDQFLLSILESQSKKENAEKKKTAKAKPPADHDDVLEDLMKILDPEDSKVNKPTKQEEKKEVSKEIKKSKPSEKEDPLDNLQTLLDEFTKEDFAPKDKKKSSQVNDIDSDSKLLEELLGQFSDEPVSKIAPSKKETKKEPITKEKNKEPVKENDPWNVERSEFYFRRSSW